MAQFLRQSSAIDIRLGPFIDVGDGFTPETGVTIAASDEKAVLKANGAATVTMAGAFGAVTGADGWYDYTASAGDLDTPGDVTFVMQDDDVYLPVFARFQVVEEEVYDDMFAASAVGYLKPTTVGRDLNVSAGNAVVLVDTCTTNTDMRGTESALLASSAPTNFGDLSIVVTTGLVDITQAAADKVWSTAARILTASTNFNDIAAADVWSVATRVLTAGTNLNDLSTAQVNTEVDNALNTAIPGGPVADSINQRILAMDDLTQAAGGGDLAAILTDTGELQGDTHTAAEVWTSGTRSLTDKAGFSLAVGGVIDGAIAAAELLNIADGCLDRRLDLGTDTGGDTTTSRTWRDALRVLRNRADNVAGTLTVYEEDDVTAAFTAAISTAAGDPIIQVNPT